MGRAPPIATSEQGAQPPEIELRFLITRAWTSGPERNQSTVTGIKGGVSGRLQLLGQSTQQAAGETVASK